MITPPAAYPTLPTLNQKLERPAARLTSPATTAFDPRLILLTKFRGISVFRLEKGIKVPGRFLSILMDLLASQLVTENRTPDRLEPFQCLYFLSPLLTLEQNEQFIITRCVWMCICYRLTYHSSGFMLVVLSSMCECFQFLRFPAHPLSYFVSNKYGDNFNLFAPRFL